VDSRREWRGSEYPGQRPEDWTGKGRFIIPGVSSEAVEQKPDRRQLDDISARRRLVVGTLRLKHALPVNSHQVSVAQTRRRCTGTKTSGRASAVCNLGLGYEMGRGPPLFGLDRSKQYSNSSRSSQRARGVPPASARSRASEHAQQEAAERTAGGRSRGRGSSGPDGRRGPVGGRSGRPARAGAAASTRGSFGEEVREKV
jgi:hypothetical protein